MVFSNSCNFLKLTYLFIFAYIFLDLKILCELENVRGFEFLSRKIEKKVWSWKIMSTWNKYLNFKQSSWIGKGTWIKKIHQLYKVCGFETSTWISKTLHRFEKKYLDLIKLHELEKIHWFEKSTQISKSSWIWKN